MDELWHATILDTCLYADLQGSLNVTLHHRPSGASEQETVQRETRLALMKLLYRRFFEDDPLERSTRLDSRPHVHHPALIRRDTMQLFIRGLNSEITRLRDIQSSYTIYQIKTMLQDRGEIPIDERRLIYAGKQLEDGLTLAEYNIQDGALIDLVLRLLGC